MSFAYDMQSVNSAISSLPRFFYSGKVDKVIGLIVEGTLPCVPVGAACRIYRRRHADSVLAEVIGLKGDKAVLMPIGTTQGIEVGDGVEIERTESSVHVSHEMLGRVLDGNAQPIDSGAPVAGGIDRSLYTSAVNPIERKLITEPLGLGVRVLDGFTTCAVGQRIAIMAGSGVGKSTLLGMIARNTQADINVIALIGERGREVREFLERDLGPEGLERSIVIVATSDTPALVRVRAAFVATCIAEYFRDTGSKVLLMMDSLTRFAMASREIGLALGEPPTVKGYTPSFFSILPKLLERVGTSKGQGSITALYTILTEGDDLQDPVADAVRAIVDGHVVLSRRMSNVGFYPPVEVLESVSRVMRNVVSSEHFNAASIVRSALSTYEEMEDYIKMGVYTPGKNPGLDKIMSKIDAIKSFLRQDVEDFTNFEETAARLQKLAMELN